MSKKLISPFPTVDVDPNLDKESPEYLEALAQATEELEFCVNLCKSRVMMVTCFDISMPTPGAPEGRREVEVWGRKESRRGETRKWENKGWRDVSLGRRATSDRDGTRVDLCMKTEEIYSASLPRTCFQWQRNEMRAQMLLPAGQGGGHHLLKSQWTTPGSAFSIVFVLSHYFSYGAGIFSIPRQTLNILLLRKKYFILHCIVYLYDYVVCTNILLREKK